MAEVEDGEAAAIAENLARVKAAIAAAASRAGRAPAAVTLVAVTKTHGANAIEAAIYAGQRVFGENRVQEAKAKWPAIKARHADLRLHLIGPLQTNKAADAVQLFDVIESLDREKLARVLADEMRKQGRALPVYIQVNTGREPQKTGALPEAADGLVAKTRALGLDVKGLMCIPPFDEDPSPHFALLAEIARRNGIEYLSMGMSADFEAAIAQGATHVRLGTALFGER